MKIRPGFARFLKTTLKRLYIDCAYKKPTKILQEAHKKLAQYQFSPLD